MKSFIKKLISWATATATVATMSVNIAAFADEKYPSIGNVEDTANYSTSSFYADTDAFNASEEGG